jgi:hypothetical protein
MNWETINSLLTKQKNNRFWTNMMGTFLPSQHKRLENCNNTIIWPTLKIKIGTNSAYEISSSGLLRVKATENSGLIANLHRLSYFQTFLNDTQGIYNNLELILEPLIKNDLNQINQMS